MSLSTSRLSPHWSPYLSHLRTQTAGKHAAPARQVLGSECLANDEEVNPANETEAVVPPQQGPVQFVETNQSVNKFIMTDSNILQAKKDHKIVFFAQDRQNSEPF